MVLPILKVLFSYISTSRRMCIGPNRTVFCSSLISCFHVVLLRYFMNDFEMVPFTHTINGTLLLLFLIITIIIIL